MPFTLFGSLYAGKGKRKSKLTCSWYHSVAVGRGRFRSRLFDYGKVASPACRFCGGEDETVDHIFFSCPKLSGSQRKLSKACENLNLEFSLCNLFTNKSLQRKVEGFLYQVFSNELEESDKEFFFIHDH